MIEIKNVTKKYGDKVAVDNMSFTVNDGDIFAFIGHNGAGKTTLIKAIVGIHDFDNGDIIINGSSIKDDYEIDEDTRNNNITKYAKMFEIENNLGDTINSFSHGMKQKITLIAALAHNPKILIMDEPFVGLDPKAVFDMKELMRDMVKEGKTIFFSTHILKKKKKLCTKVAIIKNGKLVKEGSMKDIKGDKSLEKVFLELEQ